MFGGIDPGKTGAIAILDNKGAIYCIFKTPTIGKEYDKQAMLTSLMADKVSHFVLEDVHATQMGGKASNFDFGRGKGLWEMALVALGISHELVPPKKWQKEVWTAKKVMKPGKKRPVVDAKPTSLLTAKMLWPKQDWRNISEKTGNRLSSIDDGAVDAALMAEYCRRNYNRN